MGRIDYLIAVALGLGSAALLYTRASQAPASYIGNFTAPWFPPIALFIAVVLPPIMLRLRMHKVPGMRRPMFFIILLPLLGGALGVYMALRYVIEMPDKTVADWLIAIVGTATYILANGALLYWSLRDDKKAATENPSL